MGAGLVPLHVKKHGADHDGDEEIAAPCIADASRHARLCAILPLAAEYSTPVGRRSLPCLVGDPLTGTAFAAKGRGRGP
jgi:hypothetical protein